VKQSIANPLPQVIVCTTPRSASTRQLAVLPIIIADVPAVARAYVVRPSRRQWPSDLIRAAQVGEQIIFGAEALHRPPEKTFLRSSRGRLDASITAAAMAAVFCNYEETSRRNAEKGGAAHRFLRIMIA